MSKKRVVVVGGGTGTHTVLRGLKRYADTLTITAIVSMADSGGSTGRLRDEFGQLPAGDVRNALTALAAEGDEHDFLMRQLFMYRFSRGEGLHGHNFGNLFLTVLTDILGSEVAAIKAAAKILRVAGEVIPVTTDHVHLVATYENGTVVTGEHDIDEVCDTSLASLHIVDFTMKPDATINPEAKAVLLAADLIVLGPGDLYTSVLANCVVGGFAETLRASTAKKVYVSNIMSKRGQTVGLHAQGHVDAVVRYSGITPDAVIIPSDTLPADLVALYQAEGNHQVQNDMHDTKDLRVVSVPLLAKEVVRTVQGDILTRSLIRHDSDLLAKVLCDLIP